MYVFALGSSPSLRGPPVGDLVTWSGVGRGALRRSPCRHAAGAISQRVVNEPPPDSSLRSRGRFASPLLEPDCLTQGLPPIGDGIVWLRDPARRLRNAPHLLEVFNMLLARPDHVRPVFDGEESFPHRRLLAVGRSPLARPDNPEAAVRCNEEGVENVARLRHVTTLRLWALCRSAKIAPGPDMGWTSRERRFVSPTHDENNGRMRQGRHPERKREVT